MSARILTGTKASLTYQRRYDIHQAESYNNQNDLKSLENPQGFTVDREKIKNDAKEKILAKKTTDSNPMYAPILELNGNMGTQKRVVVNPYNTDRKSKSLVDQKARQAVKSNAYPKRKVASNQDKYVQKVRVYVYKDPSGQTVARKTEHAYKQPYNAMAEI